MRNSLAGFHTPTTAQFEEMWEKCIFIVDTSFLINIYRYEAVARNELLDILTSISTRLWIPYYAALEFQRNRPNVIAEQKGKFREVRKILAKNISQLEGEISKLQLKRRHNLINTDELIADIKSATEAFQNKLNIIESKQIDVHEDLEIRAKIETLFEAKVGPKPDKDWIGKVFSVGADRYERKVPPGYCDRKKEFETEAVFNYGGIQYERKFGDLIIWQQIIDFASTIDRANVIFLTDDSKEDWWWIVDSGGEKRLGPRPELIEEFQRECSADSFFMYNSEQFLSFAKIYLHSDVSDQTIKEVREVSTQDHDDYLMNVVRGASNSIRKWLSFRFLTNQVSIPKDNLPDFVVRSVDGTKQIGIEYTTLSQINKDSPLRYQIEFYVEKLSACENYHNINKYFIIVVLVGVADQIDRVHRIIDEINQSLTEKFEVLSAVIADANNPELVLDVDIFKE